MDIRATALILAWVAILVLALAMAGLLRQVQALTTGRAPEERFGLAVGTTAPALQQDRADWGEMLTLAMFLDIGCSSCDHVLKAADEMTDLTAGRLRFIALFPAKANGVQPRRVEVLEDALHTFASYLVSATPYAVVIDREGRVAETMPLGAELALDRLVEQTLEGE